MNSIICPISEEKIDSNVSRMTVFINVVIMALFFYTNDVFFAVIVFLDYFIRAALKASYSPIRYLAIQLVRLFKKEGKNINVAQKVFASRLGMLCALASIIFYYFDNQMGSYISMGVLIVLSFADSVFNFCVGCLIYNYLVYPFYKSKENS